MRIFPGLVSISFRKLSIEKIITLCADSGLGGIEWGGDIHVPHGDVGMARDVKNRTQDAGLCVAAYGSYYKAGESKDLPFNKVLDSAIALGAPTIRVWAGAKGSAQADAAYFDKVIKDLEQISQLALSAGITISLEFHSNTLTDSVEATVKLLESLSEEGVYTYWQPPVGDSIETCEVGLRSVLSRLSNIHVFHWDKRKRLALAEGRQPWSRYFNILRQMDQPRWALLEFVPDDDPAILLREATTLRELLAIES